MTENPANGEDQLDLLQLIPDPVQISQRTGNDNIDNIIYTIRENGTANGKTCIEDSHGYTYSYQKSTTAKAPLFISKWTYWQCIKRQYKGINNCKCYLKIEKFEEGARNMIVQRQGGHD